MKKIALITIVISAVFLVGCSNNNTNQQAPVSTPQPSSPDLSNIDPTLTQDGFVRVQLTDPALYDYLQRQNLASVGNTTPSVNAEDQKKIGRTVQFQKAYKYGIAGTATVVSPTRIKVGQFTYNGACGPIKIGLTINNKPESSLATVKEISAAVSASQFDIDIPSNLSLSQFDSLAVFCSDSPEPVSTADLSGF